MPRCLECAGLQQNRPVIAGSHAACLQFESMAQRGGLSTKDPRYGGFCDLYRSKRVLSDETISDQKLFETITGLDLSIDPNKNGSQNLLFQYEHWYEEPETEVSNTDEQ